MNQHPIFLLGAHKSGTSLLRSIFDGHSQLYAIPIEAHYFQNAKYWVDYDYRSERPEAIIREEFIERFCQWIHHTNTSSDRFSDSVAQGIFDENRFREAISKITDGDTDKIRMEKYLQAIYYSVTGRELPENIRIVEKSIENAEFALELQSFFPQAKFIHIVRNPYANIVSFRKFKSFEYGAPLMPRVIRSLYNSFYYLYRNRRLIKKYLIIRYEELATTPEKVIHEICRFLSIPFEEILLTPTYQGEFWVGNSTSGEVFQGISASNLDRWKEDIYPIEVYFINKIFPHVVREFGYEYFPENGSFWKRMKGESWNRYLFNRIYKFYLL